MKTKPRAIRFSEIEEHAIEQYAHRHGMTFSDVVRKSTETFLSMNGRERLSLNKLAERAIEEDPDLLYGQFLDDFSHSDDKAGLISKEPDWKGSDATYWLCLLAATAHKLAHDNSRPVPKWALDEQYVSPTPIYGMNTENPDFQAFLKETTPMEFRCHNIFLGDNALSRA
ncbi:hypothetical protein [Paraeggerthella hongkongensis]|uniref:Uncharacterized protein n=1 Tax=Paraeggerthella hongkongensis TaxID=230658 RepID=A0A3N0BF06_9ACTN|nr:hypothetical protein [Paraeggerthella hongkongensis]RNL45770.1 hypothetical protein DMP08_05485 [Paraeggerthella hongkongensis]